MQRRIEEAKVVSRDDSATSVEAEDGACPRSCLHGAGAEDGDELGGTEAWDGDELGEPEREMTTSSAASLAPRIWQAASPLLALSSPPSPPSPSS